MKWVKRNDGWFCGVFEGLGYRTNLNPNLFRAIWLLSLFLFGSGFLFYFLLVMIIPHEDEIRSYEMPKFLGVCYNISKRLDMELSIVRLLTVGTFFLSGGTVFLVYLALWLLLPKQIEYRY